MSSTDIIILRSYLSPSSSLDHDAVCTAVGALFFFHWGLAWSSVLFSFVVSSGRCRMSSGPYLLFFVVAVGNSFVCRRGLFVSLTGPVRALLQSQFYAALAVLGSTLWRARPGSVHNLRRPLPPRRSTCLGS